MIESMKTQYYVTYTNDIGDGKSCYFNDSDHVKLIFPRGHIDGYVVSANPEEKTVTLEISDGVEYDIDLTQIVAITVFKESTEEIIEEYKKNRRAKAGLPQQIASK